MSIWNFACKNIRSAKARYLISAAVSACMLAAIVVALCSLQDTFQQQEALRLEYGATAQVYLCPSSQSEADAGFYPLPSYAQLMELKEHPCVTDVQVDGFFHSASRSDTELFQNGELSYLNGWTSYIIGYNMAEQNMFSDCSEADFKQGRMFSGQSECVVSSVTAQRNALQPGDVLRFVDTATGAALELTLTGIVDSAKMESRFADPDTAYVFTDMKGPAAAFGNLYRRRTTVDSNSAQPYYDGYNAVIRLDSPAHFNTFAQDMLQKATVVDGIVYNYLVSYAKGGYQELSDAIRPVSQRSLLVGLIVALLFLALTLTTAVVNLRARRHQFGILMSMGMPRSQIAGSYCLEQLLVFFAGAIPGAVMGMLAAQALRLSSAGSMALRSALDVAGYGFAILLLTVAIAACIILRLRPAKLLRS